MFLRILNFPFVDENAFSLLDVSIGLPLGLVTFLSILVVFGPNKRCLEVMIQCSRQVISTAYAGHFKGNFLGFTTYPVIFIATTLIPSELLGDSHFSPPRVTVQM